jgi:dihydroneopterin aldolase
MQFYAYHGGSPEERSLGQTFQVDFEAELDLSAAGRSDNREDTVSYTHLYRVVKEVMEGEPKNLLEALAEEIARRALDSFPIQGVRVLAKKHRPPIKGAVLSGAAVEIYRTRTGPPSSTKG